MANELDKAIVNAANIIKEIKKPNVTNVWTEEPRGMRLKGGAVGVAVLLNNGTLGQNAAQERGELHRLVLRSYINFQQNTGKNESIMRQMMDVLQTKFEANITLNGSEGVTMAIIVGDYDTKYQRVGGLIYRLLDIPLHLSIRKSVTWQQE